jgi:hypothetical protein
MGIHVPMHFAHRWYSVISMSARGKVGVAGGLESANENASSATTTAPESLVASWSVSKLASECRTQTGRLPLIEGS